MHGIIRYVFCALLCTYCIYYKSCSTLTHLYIHYLMKEKHGRGTKRKGVNYGSRRGETLVPYKRGLENRFVAYHCKLAFGAGSKCVDAICHKCKLNPENKDHSCPECNQNIGDYSEETNQGYMPRKRPNWEGPGPVVCGICEITM